MWSVAQDTLQSASDWTSGPGWFRHHQHKLGQTGVGVGEPVLRLLRRDDPSQLCDQVSKGPSQWDTRGGLVPAGCPGDSRTGNAGPTARGSVIGGTDLGQPSRLGIART